MPKDWRLPVTGVNFGGWLSQSDLTAKRLETFITRADFAFVRERGFNTVRLPFDARLVQARDGGLRAEGVAWLTKALEWCRAEGLRLILDLHEIEGHSFTDMSQNDLYQDPALRSRARKLWVALARHFAKEGEYLFFELLNEAVAPEARLWQDLAEDLTAAIRGVDPSRPLVVGSNLWNCAGEFANLKPTGDARTVYTFHFYEPIHVTHQGAPWVKWAAGLPLPQPYPGKAVGIEAVLGRGDTQAEAQARHLKGVWNSRRLEEALQPVLEFRARHRVPIFCGEFGVYLKAPRETQLAWMRDFTGLLVKHGFGFTYWSHRGMDFGLYYEGAPWGHLPQYSNPAHLDTELADLLAERARRVAPAAAAQGGAAAARAAARNPTPAKKARPRGQAVPAAKARKRPAR